VYETENDALSTALLPWMSFFPISIAKSPLMVPGAEAERSVATMTFLPFAWLADLQPHPERAQ